MSHSIGNTARSLIAAAYFALPGGCTPQDTSDTKVPAKPEPGDAFVQVDPIKTLNQAPKAEPVTNKPEKLDDRDEAFMKSDLFQKLDQLDIPQDQAGFLVHTPETLKQAIAVIEANSGDIAKAFKAELLPGADGKKPEPKFKLAISFQGDKVPSQLRGTALLVTQDKELKIKNPNFEYLVRYPTVMLYGKLGYKIDGKDGDAAKLSKHLRLRNGGEEVKRSADAVIDPKTGILTTGTMTVNLDFIPGPVRYGVIIDSKAKITSTAVEPKKDDEGKMIRKTIITLPASAVVIHEKEES